MEVSIKSTWSLLPILLAIAGASASAATAASSDIAEDEHLIFFDTSAWLDEDTDEWHVPIHGWIYEPEESVARKAIFRETLESVFELQIDKDAESTLARRLGLLIADNERGKRIVIEIAGERVSLPPSAENGHLQTTLTLPATALHDAEQEGVVAFDAITARDEARRFGGRVHLVGTTGQSIISDIDDTVKITEVTDRRRMLQNTFLRDFQPVPGMAELYRQWIGPEGSVHFVSSSPWQLHAPLQEFLTEAGFPAGSMHLKSVRFRDETLFDLFKEGTETKPAVIREILERYPRRTFILVGDSGEQDPEIYAELLRGYPDQITRAFIRNVTNETRGNSRFSRVFEGIEANRWELFEEGDDLRADEEISSFDPIRATIGDVHRAISSGSQSCEDIVRTYLTRIENLDQKTGLNAIIFTNPAALYRAREIDAALARGERPGPLYCVPVLLKDNMDTADMPTSGGSIALKASVPPDDAFVVQRLREAGAIIIAKTNMAEWAFSPRQTLSSSYGATANAYDLERVPAGSSGGTASGIAAGFGVVGMGSDTGNSIRGPSSHLSLFGIRSSMGLVSRDGVIPLAFDRDVVGPMTRTVEDSARVLSVIAGVDPADPYTRLIPDGALPEYVDALAADALQGRRIGVLRALVDTEDAAPEVIALFEQALEDLAAAGAILVDDFAIMNLDAHMEASNFCVRFRYDMRAYLQSLGSEAPLEDVMQVLETGQYSPYIEERLKFFGANPADVPPAELDPPCPDYPEHPGRQAFLSDVVESMDRAGVDAIAYPTWTNPPAPMDRASEEYRGDNSQLIAPATGLPAVSVPMGYSSGSLPAGLQLLGRPFSEALLIALSYAYEQHTRHWRPPEGFRLE